MTFHIGHALLIGVSSYNDAKLGSYASVAADADGLAAVLKDNQYCGYHNNHVTSITGTQANLATLNDAFVELGERAKPDDTVVILYAGHGVYDSSGVYQLTTADTSMEGKNAAPGTALSHSALLGYIKAINVKRLLLIVNACHAGELSPTLGDAPQVGATLPQTTADAVLATGSGRVVITACGDDQVSFVGAGANTIFGKALIDGFKGKGTNSIRGYISVFDLYTHLYDTIPAVVERTIAPATRTYFKGTPQPEFSMLKGVGPFPIALFRGATTLGEFPTDSPPPDRDGARLVSPKASQEQLQRIGATLTFHNSKVGVVNTGTITTQTNTIDLRD